MRVPGGGPDGGRRASGRCRGRGHRPRHRGRGSRSRAPAAYAASARPSPLTAMPPRRGEESRRLRPGSPVGSPSRGYTPPAMGKVVRLEPARGKRAGTAKSAAVAKPRRRRPRRWDAALGLGGGGFTGGVYEIGALRALDLLSVNRNVNQFDIYVGTSAGSFVAAMAANGITPEEMMRVVNQQVPTPFRDIDLNTLLRPNIGEWVKKGALLPFRAAGMARALAGQLGSISVMDIGLGLAEGLPSGMYSSAGIEGYLGEVLGDLDRTADFRL